jgi:hypothetical protein
VALAVKTALVSEYSPITTGILSNTCLSPAIASIVFPRNCVWSKPILVITDTNG